MHTRTYIRLGLVYMERQRMEATASCSLEANRLGRNEENASCSLGGNGMHRVHREPTSLDGTAETGSGVPQNGANDLLFECLRSKWGAADREGCGVPQNGGNELVLERLRSKRGPVHQEGCDVPQNGTPRATVHPPSTTSLQPPWATIHPPSIALLQPRRATVHPTSTSSSLHGLLYIHGVASTGYCTTSPPWGPVHPPFNGYYSTSPPRGPVHQLSIGYYSWSLHGVLFIYPPPASSIGVLFIQRQRPTTTTGSFFIQPPSGTIHPTPNSVHCSSRGSRFDWLQLGAVAKESLDRVQLTSRDRSIARVQ
jgi:hypothetical protein